MIIGLLDVRWERRHGCSLGLMGLLHGLGLGSFPDTTELSDPLDSQVLSESLNNEKVVGDDTTEIEKEEEKERERGRERGIAEDIPEDDTHTVVPPASHSSSSSSSSFSSSVPSILPQYLVEDIICTGVCLLMLDRFIDLRASSSSGVSPAKEVTEYPIMKRCSITSIRKKRMIHICAMRLESNEEFIKNCKYFLFFIFYLFTFCDYFSSYFYLYCVSLLVTGGSTNGDLCNQLQ